MYSEGSTAVKQDNKTAFNWFKKAADAVRISAFFLSYLGWSNLLSPRQQDYEYDSCFLVIAGQCHWSKWPWFDVHVWQRC